MSEKQFSRLIPETPEAYREWWRTNSTAPYGECWCGCGQETSIAKATTIRVQGEPGQFVKGHAHTRPPTDTDYLVEERGFDTPCWIWQRHIASSGYGCIRDRSTGNVRHAHRVYYEKYIGPIPEDHVLHHACEVKRCVNPAHLRPMLRVDHQRHHWPSGFGPNRTIV